MITENDFSISIVYFKLLVLSISVSLLIGYFKRQILLNYIKFTKNNKTLLRGIQCITDFLCLVFL